MRYDLAFRRDGFHSALMTTYRFDPPVFEDVILLRMASHGCCNVAVLADGRMLDRAFADGGLARSAGVRYHLAKRRLNGAFHPKLVLQLGAAAGRLMIGSANLTGAGIRSNIETMSSLEVTPDDAAAAPLLAAALDYFESHADPGDAAMREVIARARHWTPWLDGVEPAPEVDIGGVRVRLVTEADDGGVGGSLLRVAAGDAIARIVCLSPYWDRNLAAVRRLARETGAGRVDLVVDAGGQDFTREAFAALGGAGLHALGTGGGSGKPRRRLHAKLMVFEGAGFDYLLAGSANMSSPGLFSGTDHGNAEAGLLCRLPAGSAIEQLALGPCLAADFPPEELSFREEPAHDTEADDHSARPDGGAIVEELGALFWNPPPGVDPARCAVDLIRHDEVVVATAEVVRKLGRWVLDAEISTLGSAHYGVVRFEGGGASAPVLIVGLDALRKAAKPVSPRVERILRTISSADDLDVETVELLHRVLLQIEEQSAGQSAGQSATRDGDQAARRPPRHGSQRPDEAPSGFAAAAPAGSAAGLDRAALCGGIRALLNRAMAIYLDLDAERDALAEEIDPATPPPAPPPPAPPVPPVPPVPPFSPPPAPATGLVRAAEAGKTAPLRLGKLVDAVVRALSGGKADPLAETHALSIRILIGAILKEAMPAESGEARLPPATRYDWVRLLGRLLQPVPGALRSAAGGRSGPLVDEQVEFLAILRWCAFLCLEVAQAQQMKDEVVRPLVRIVRAMQEEASTLLPGDTGARLTERCGQALDEKYARLRTAACSPRLVRATVGESSRSGPGRPATGPAARRVGRPG